jgi:hypothetical protein
MAQNQTVLGNMSDHPEAIDVKSTAATATMVNGKCRLMTITQTSAGTAGTVIWRDGGPGGTTLFTTYSATNSQNNIAFPKHVKMATLKSVSKGPRPTRRGASKKRGSRAKSRKKK